MSDTVDDLHAAEEAASAAVPMLEELLELAPRLATRRADVHTLARLVGRAEQLVASWEAYCRPSCGAEGDKASTECPDDTCGCPCGHTDAEVG